jgi:hypothetical protein
MVGSGDVKLARAAWTSTRDTDSAGLDDQWVQQPISYERLPRSCLVKVKSEISSSRERKGLFGAQCRTFREQSFGSLYLGLGVIPDLPNTTLLDFQLLHLELPTKSSTIIRSAQNSSFIRIYILSDLVVVS